MKSIITKVLSAVLALGICLGAFNIQSFAYSAIPEYFDFGDSVVSMDAGSVRDVWLRSTYKYNCYLGPHTSNRTYIECSDKAGSEYVRIHIGADETEKNVFFYFYVRDDAVADRDIHDCIEVYVQNIDYSYVQRADQAAPLKWYAFNNGEFNAYYYYMNYADLRSAIGLNGDELYNHYYTTGIYEGRVANKLK